MLYRVGLYRVLTMKFMIVHITHTHTNFQTGAVVNFSCNTSTHASRDQTAQLT